MMSGTLTTVISDIKNNALRSKGIGLTSMSMVNKQLVGDKK